MATGFIKITVDEYKELLVTKIGYENLLDVLLTEASLSWNKKGIRFDDDNLNSYLKIAKKDLYDRVFTELKKADEEAEKAKKAKKEDPNE